MSEDAPIKTGQTWISRAPARLKSSPQVAIIGARGEEVRIERYYPHGRSKARREWISITGLRRRYRPHTEQTTLL